MFFDNHIIFSDYQDLNLDFKDYLKNKDSLIFKKCNNIEITIDSKINKLIFIKSTNITLKCKNTISGIDIEHCQNFIFIPNKPYQFNYIDCYKSHLEIHVNNDEIYDLIKLNNQHSTIKLIFDK